MGRSSDSFWESAIYRRTLSRWAYSARTARQANPVALGKQAEQARQLRAHLDELIHIADERLSEPPEKGSAPSAPHNADWAWQPGLWTTHQRGCNVASVQQGTQLGEGVSVFHDCVRSEVTCRQIRNRQDRNCAPYAIRLDVFNFGGGYLSFVIDLPAAASVALTRTHIFRIDAFIDFETPLEVFARLNIAHGPNTEQIVREFDMSNAQTAAEFDLAYAEFNEKRIDKCWVDLIFENPQMNQVTVRDLTFSRRPRAQV